MALPAVALGAVSYIHIARGYFLNDDFLNLYRIANEPLLEYLLTPHGGHVLLARNAVFAATAFLFGTEAHAYFWCVFLTHLLNVWLLFRLLLLLTKGPYLAMFGAALWGACPLQQGTLGWYSVYGQAMVATAFLLILADALRLEQLGLPLSRGRRAWWLLLALWGATSFGTGTAIAAALPIALGLLMPSATPSRIRPPLRALLLFVPFMYFGLLATFDHVSGIAHPSFRPDVLLVVDWWITILATLKLTAYGLVGLVCGLGQAPRFPLWVTYLLATLLATLIAYGALSDRYRRRPFAAFVILLLACNAMIAIGRGALILQTTESGLYGAMRYHYVGTLLITVLCSLALAGLRSRSNRLVVVAPNLLIVWYGVSLLAIALIAPPSPNDEQVRQRVLEVIADLREEIDRAPAFAPAYIRNRVFTPVSPALLSVETFPGLAAAFVIYFPDNVVDGRSVYFVEYRRAVLAATARGRRTGTLVIPVRSLGPPLAH